MFSPVSQNPNGAGIIGASVHNGGSTLCLLSTAMTTATTAAITAVTM